MIYKFQFRPMHQTAVEVYWIGEDYSKIQAVYYYRNTKNKLTKKILRKEHDYSVKVSRQKGRGVVAKIIMLTRMPYDGTLVVMKGE